jgi:phage-related protein
MPLLMDWVASFWHAYAATVSSRAAQAGELSSATQFFDQLIDIVL